MADYKKEYKKLDPSGKLVYANLDISPLNVKVRNGLFSKQTVGATQLLFTVNTSRPNASQDAANKILDELQTETRVKQQKGVTDALLDAKQTKAFMKKYKDFFNGINACYIPVGIKEIKKYTSVEDTTMTTINVITTGGISRELIALMKFIVTRTIHTELFKH